LRELSSAVDSDRKSGIQRGAPVVGRSASICSIRSIAAGLTTASHRPPSEANPFCGAK
jgi:hypothetical protein